MAYKEEDVLGYDSYQKQLDDARKKLTQLANPNMAQPQQTPQQATQSVTQPVETGTVYIPGVGMIDKATSKVIQPENKPVTPTQPQSNINPLQQQLAEQKRKASISSLDYARQQALSDINTQRQALPKQTLSTLGQARASADISARNLKEYMAQRFGTSISGAEGQGLMNIQTQRQGAESQANLNEQQALADLGARESEIGSKYAFDVANVEAGIQSQALQDELARQQQLELQARQDALRQEGYAREDALRQQGFEREDMLNAQELERRRQELARQEEINTLGRYGADFAAEIERRKATPDTADDALIPYLEEARMKKIATNEQSRLEAQREQIQAQAEFEKAQYDRAMNIWEQTGIADANVARIIGVPVGTKTSDKEYRDAQIALDKLKEQRARQTAAKSSTPKPAITYQQALTQARLILGDGASPQEILNLTAQLQNVGSGGQLGELPAQSKPAVKPPKGDNPSVKSVYDYLFKLQNARDLVSINQFMANNSNIKELETIIKNPTSTDDEIETARAILKDFGKYR